MRYRALTPNTTGTAAISGAVWSGVALSGVAVHIFFPVALAFSVGYLIGSGIQKELRK